MSFPQIRLAPLLYLLIVSISTTSLLFGQTPTPTPPLDTDDDGVPDHKDGWPQHKQLTSPPIPESQYVAIDLGHGTGYGINNLGDVVGEADNDNGGREAILWRLGQPPAFLGFLTQDQTVNRESIAWAINDARQITGRSTYSWDANVSGEYPNPPTYPVWDSYSSTHAFLWEAGAMTDLNDLTLGQPADPNFPDPANKVGSEGRAINPDGVVVGNSNSEAVTQNIEWSWHIVSGGGRVASFNGAAPTDLGIASPDGSSDATAINDHGAIAGTGGSYGQSAFFKLNGQTQMIAPTSGANRANGLNNLDHVVGILGNSSSAFIWVPTSNLPENERVIDLSAVSLAANFQYTGADAINDRDQIVGSGSFGGTGNREALLWQNGKLHRLNDLIGLHLNFNLEAAPAINQSGMIVAHAPNSSDGEAFLLVPVELWDVKGPNSPDDDVIISPLPPRGASESDNDYIQRQLTNRPVAFIKPHLAPSNSPKMPHLVAKLPAGPPNLKVRWRLEVAYKRGNGYRAAYVEDFSRSEDKVTIPATAQDGAPTFTPEMDATENWRIFENDDWNTELQQRGLFGGTAKLYVWFPAIDPQPPIEPVLTFRIGGKNPDEDKARTFIDAAAGTTFWYAYAIAKHETFGRVRENGNLRYYNQFYTNYQGGPIGDNARDMGWVAWAKAWPVYNLDRDSKSGPQNGPGGYGLFQLTLGPKHPNDPVEKEAFVSRSQIWNWQDNTRRAVGELQGKLAIAQGLVQGLQATYPKSGQIPNYRHFSGLEATTTTYYNGMAGGEIQKVPIKGFKKDQKTCWLPTTNGWTFLQNRNRYCEAVDARIE
jgi:uncharacterized membrane protein